jgi:beta-galactosidase
MRKGKGKAMVIGFEAARACFRRGNVQEEKFLINLLNYLDVQAPVTSDQAIVYRLAGPDVDHLFLMNESASSVEVELKFYGQEYKFMMDAVKGEEFETGRPVKIEAHGARWLRLKK